LAGVFKIAVARRTKIVCTIGPAVDSEEKIKGLIHAGMNVARINCSHGEWETRKRWIAWVRKHSPDIAPVAILVDLQGPKFRVGDVADGMLRVTPNEQITAGPTEGATVPIKQPEILAAMKPGSRLLLGDGDVELKVTSKSGEDCICRALSGGLIKSRQGVTVVGQSFDSESLTEKDREDIRDGIEAGADVIALSYVHTAADIDGLRAEVAKYNSYVKLCAKIETKAALKNIKEIATNADMVMVARGDLGLQMDIEEVPLAQKKIIRTAQECGKPVITATQMLESMVHAARPTRAEATDVANAILDGTDAVMLSGETATGEYPIEAVQYMSRIAVKAESIFDNARLLMELCQTPDGTVDATEAVAHSVAQLAALVHPKAIVTTTASGRTACLVSKFRPKTPILCAAWNRKVQAQMAFVWGVECILIEMARRTDEQIENAVNGFVRQKRLKSNDQVIVSAGVPPGTAGNTNLIWVYTVKA
jgi:pyruvate kinase